MVSVAHGETWEQAFNRSVPLRLYVKNEEVKTEEKTLSEKEELGDEITKAQFVTIT